MIYEQHNKIQINHANHITKYLHKNGKLDIFMIIHPGSYVGVRKISALSLVAKYTNMNIYTCDLMSYYSTIGINVIFRVGNHLWIRTSSQEFISKTVPDNVLSLSIVCNDQALCDQYKFQYHEYNIIDIWNNRYDIFKRTKYIIKPKYFDKYVDMVNGAVG